MLNSHKCPGKRESKKRNKKGGKGRCCCKQDDDRVTREQVLVGSEEWPCSPTGQEETVGAKALRQERACCVPEPSWEASDTATVTKEDRGEKGGRKDDIIHSD